MRTIEDRTQAQTRWREEAEGAIDALRGKHAGNFDVPQLEGRLQVAMAKALEEAVLDLVDASNDNTSRMTSLQGRIVNLTKTYVILTAAARSRGSAECVRGQRSSVQDSLSLKLGA